MLISTNITKVFICESTCLLDKQFESTICIKLLNCTPSQGNSLHVTVSSAGPPQLFPPQDGTGLSQLLVLSLTQDSEQFPTNQSDHPPLTI